MRSHFSLIALVGYFASIDEGSAMKRVVIGFGSGSAELVPIIVTAAGLDYRLRCSSDSPKSISLQHRQRARAADALIYHRARRMS